MTTSLREQLQSTLGAAYTLERELGGGGMSRVFVAEERALGRKVVVKVLSTELGTELSLERFTREVKVAARLQHPNIVPVHSAGEAGGTPYYTMPFVRGESLRAKLDAASAPMPMEQAISVLRDLARALAYAHSEGVVHRDIKPENILLSGDVAVVADFGIAKAIDAARSRGGSATLTQLGTSIGTPAYMAPEQAAGDPGADHRTDLYAWGLVAYECIAGSHPFAGKRTPFELVTAHLIEQPGEISAKRPETAPVLAGIVMRCLEKDPANRPANAADLLAALQQAVSTPSMMQSAVMTPSARGGAGVVSLSPTNAVAATPSLAVLPFTNLSADAENEWLADGIAEELMLALGKSGGIRVVGRTSSFAFKGKSVDLRTIGEQLHVTTVLEGSVRRAGNRVRIGAQLTNVGDGFQLWSDRYDRELTDIFAIQDEISASIASALETTLGTRSGGNAAVASPVNATQPVNVQAFEHYVKGRLLLSQRGPGLTSAAQHFARAIELQPDFALAYAALGEFHASVAMWGRESPDMGFSRSAEMIRRAEELSPDAPEVMAARAVLQIYRDWVPASEPLLRAIARNGSIESIHSKLAIEHVIRLRFDAARASMDRATQLEPLSGSTWGLAAFIAWESNRVDDALRYAERGLSLMSENWIAYLAMAGAYVELGDAARAVAASEEMTRYHPSPVSARLFHAGILAWAGERTAAIRFVEAGRAARQAGQHVSWWFMAVALAGLGDMDAAVVELEAAYRAREPSLIFLRCVDAGMAGFEALRTDPRVRAIISRFDDDARAKGHRV